MEPDLVGGRTMAIGTVSQNSVPNRLLDPTILVSPVAVALSRVQFIIVMFAPCVALVCR